MEALIGAMQYAEEKKSNGSKDTPIHLFTNEMREVIHLAMVAGKGTKDICGARGLTTESFVELVGGVLDGSIAKSTLMVEQVPDTKKSPSLEKSFADLDGKLVRKIFNELDENDDGVLEYGEFVNALIRLNVHPKAFNFKAEKNILKGTARDRV